MVRECRIGEQNGCGSEKCRGAAEVTGHAGSLGDDSDREVADKTVGRGD
jgi:hypothetical protein